MADLTGPQRADDRRHRPDRRLDRPGPARARAGTSPASTPTRRRGRAGARARRDRRRRASTPTPRSPSSPRRSARSPPRSRAALAETTGRRHRRRQREGARWSPPWTTPASSAATRWPAPSRRASTGADADLFEGAVWVLTPVADTDADALRHRRRRRAARSAPRWWRCRPSATTRSWPWCPTCPHLTAATLMGLADERAEEHAALLRLAAGGFRDMTRIAAGHPGIWPDICAENRDAIVDDARPAHRRARAGCATLVADGDRDGAARPRSSGPRRPAATCPAAVARPEDLAEVRVPVPDRAGRASPRSPPWPPSSTSTSPTSRSPTRARATAACSSCWSTRRRRRAFRAGLVDRGYRPAVARTSQ